MSRAFAISDELYRYILEHSAPPDNVQKHLIEETAGLGPVSGMQIGPDQGAFFTILTRAIGARRAIEVGTFTGYSALAIAKGLGDGGLLLCCDVNEEWTSIGRRHWEEAGIADRIELRLGPALDTLRALPREPAYDMAFIDADKESYIDYHEELIPRLRTDGLLLVDNVLWSGTVADPDATDANAQALRRYNDHVAADDRVETVILSIGDGVTIARKR